MTPITGNSQPLALGYLGPQSPPNPTSKEAPTTNPSLPAATPMKNPNEDQFTLLLVKQETTPPSPTLTNDVPTSSVENTVDPLIFMCPTENVRAEQLNELLASLQNMEIPKQRPSESEEVQLLNNILHKKLLLLEQLIDAENVSQRYFADKKEIAEYQTAFDRLSTIIENTSAIIHSEASRGFNQRLSSLKMGFEALRRHNNCY